MTRKEQQTKLNKQKKEETIQKVQKALYLYLNLFTMTRPSKTHLIINLSQSFTAIHKTFQVIKGHKTEDNGTISHISNYPLNNVLLFFWVNYVFF